MALSESKKSQFEQAEILCLSYQRTLLLNWVQFYIEHWLWFVFSLLISDVLRGCHGRGLHGHGRHGRGLHDHVRGRGFWKWNMSIRERRWSGKLLAALFWGAVSFHMEAISLSIRMYVHACARDPLLFKMWCLKNTDFNILMSWIDLKALESIKSNFQGRSTIFYHKFMI